MENEQPTASSVSTKDVAALRARTGAGIMECKSALIEAHGDADNAVTILRAKQGKKIEDRGDRIASEGTVGSYIHANGKIGVMVSVVTETDFVARNDEFVNFAREVAMHIAAAAPLCLSEADIVASELETERRMYVNEVSDKPEQIRDKIVDGKLRKWKSEVVLLEQPHVNTDKYEGKTIGELLDELRASTKENVQIREFTRFTI